MQIKIDDIMTGWFLMFFLSFSEYKEHAAVGAILKISSTISKVYPNTQFT